MSDDLTPQQVLADPQVQPGVAHLELDEIQGDVLLGLQKFFQRFVFFEITNTPDFKAAVHDELVQRVTTTHVVKLREFQLRDHKAHGHKEKLPAIGFNLAFSNDGIQKLLPGAELGDASFKSGAKAQAPSLNDPADLSTWLPPFVTAPIDGVFFVTGGTEISVDAETALILDILGGSIAASYDTKNDEAKTRPGAERGHEHFGWKDGISQPGISGLASPFPGQDLLDPGRFVFGYPGEPPQPAAPAPPRPSWMKNGSFMVFRRLRQLVPEFDKFVLDQAQALGMDPVLLGARMVGRWKSGAPLALTPSQDDTILATDAQQNNDFDFADDQAQRRCPFGAHIRKTNPRQDIPKDGLDPHRIIRAGIPFGSEVTPAEKAAGQTQQERGLMFVCYQTSIPGQFEFVQSKWANNTGFVFGKKRPSDGSPVTVGSDPFIGQAAGPAGSPARTRKTDEPIPNYPTGNVRSTLNLAQDFIVPTGGGYFFVPSISALKNELTE
jgi:Dyp-type peroxidase family